MVRPTSKKPKTALPKVAQKQMFLSCLSPRRPGGGRRSAICVNMVTSVSRKGQSLVILSPTAAQMQVKSDDKEKRVRSSKKFRPFACRSQNLERSEARPPVDP